MTDQGSQKCPVCDAELVAVATEVDHRPGPTDLLCPNRHDEKHQSVEEP